MPDLLDGISLVDHHCHGVVTEPLDRTAFESMLTEADGPGRWHESLFDSQAGIAVRRFCAPLLDLPALAPAEQYLARRADLGPDEVNRRLIGSVAIGDFVVDTGFAADALTPPAELAAMTGGAGHEIVRLEQVAEQVIGATDYVDAFQAALVSRARRAVGFKSIAAYRIGLDLDPARPTTAEVRAAAKAWARTVEKSGVRRLVDPVLIRFGIWTALDIGKPLQFHVGYGDRDVDLLKCDPLQLAPLLRATVDLGVPIMLLHNYPFHRNAGYLAQVFDHVFVDVGLALQNVGTRADAVLAELLELAPFGSVLFSTDAFGLPELYVTSTALFRRALTRFLDTGLREGAWSIGDVERISRLIGRDNARRAYGLGGS
ncbi:amidohydrolase [Jatrophihabitans sp. YIM 134969]